LDVERGETMDEAAIKNMEKTLRNYYAKREELQSKKIAIEAIEKNERDIAAYCWMPIN
jgi:hypothetical protein